MNHEDGNKRREQATAAAVVITTNAIRGAASETLSWSPRALKMIQELRAGNSHSSTLANEYKPSTAPIAPAM
jgi:hypothetical protein